jgi:two-component system response regulator FixJ
MSKPNVYVVDDDFAMRDSLEMLLGARGYDTRVFRSGVEFLTAAHFMPFGCIVVDLRMPEMDGLELQERLKQRRLQFPIIVITGHADVSTAVRAMRNGAVDFVEKPFSESVILQSLEVAFNSEGPESAGAGKREILSERINRLSPREQQVMEKMVAGNSNKLTANTLGLSPRTVEVHRARVMEKMEARSLSELVRFAITAGITPEN